MGCYTSSYQHMGTASKIIRLLLLLSMLGSTIFLGMNDILLSFAGIVCWVALTFSLWVILTLIFSPIIVICTLIGALKRL